MLFFYCRYFILITITFFLLGEFYGFSSPVKTGDDITFFNTGQGHTALVRVEGAVPLLIDAGSSQQPYQLAETFQWEKMRPGTSSTPKKVSDKILKHWFESIEDSLATSSFQLNIIITHPDRDHKSFVEDIFNILLKKANENSFGVNFHSLLGGKASDYGSLNDIESHTTYYTEKYNGLISELTDIGKQLNLSNCITHVFCPVGKDRNSWSIITRVKVNSISAIFTGDANKKTKAEMLNAIGHKEEIKSDILLIPHHGAKGTFHEEWDSIVDPRALVIGAGVHDSYHHPHAETIINHLNRYHEKGRIWEGMAKPHGIQYFGTRSHHEEIIRRFILWEERMFDCVINEGTFLEQERWQVAWIDLPLYTLWCTGDLCFKNKVIEPDFEQSLFGLMPYVAVPDTAYLLPPNIRKVALSSYKRWEQIKYSDTISPEFKNHLIKLHNNDLDTVNVSFSGWGLCATGMSQLITALESNTTLRVLDLSNTHLDHGDIYSLAGAMKNNNSLIYICLALNSKIFMDPNPMRYIIDSLNRNREKIKLFSLEIKHLTSYQFYLDLLESGV